MEVSSPWPGSTRVSASRGENRRWSMERMIWPKSAPSVLVLPGPPGKSVSPLKRTGDPSARKHMDPGVARREEGVQPQAADVDHRVVLEDEVIGVQLGRVLGGDADLVPGVAHRGDSLDVVPVAMGLEHLAHVESPAELEQLLVLVGGVDQDRFARRPTAQHEHVVLERPDHDLVDLRLCVFVVEIGHEPQARGLTLRAERSSRTDETDGRAAPRDEEPM